MPACEAVTTTEPAPVKLNVEPLSEPGPVKEYVMGKLELDVAPNVIPLAPYVTGVAGAGNEIVCELCVDPERTVMLTVATLLSVPLLALKVKLSGPL